MSQFRSNFFAAGLVALGLLIASAAGVAVASIVTERAVAGFGADAAPLLPAIEIEGATPGGCTRDRAAVCPRSMQAVVERAADAGCPWARSHREVNRPPVPTPRPAADLIAAAR